MVIHTNVHSSALSQLLQVQAETVSTQSAAAGASRNSQHSVSCCRCKQKQSALSQLLQVQAETVSTQSAAASARRDSQLSVSKCKQKQSALSQLLQVQAETVSTQSAAASRNSKHSVSCCKCKQKQATSEDVAFWETLRWPYNNDQSIAIFCDTILRCVHAKSEKQITELFLIGNLFSKLPVFVTWRTLGLFRMFQSIFIHRAQWQ